MDVLGNGRQNVKIDLSYNLITSFSYFEHFRYRGVNKIMIDFNFNPIACNCSNYNFFSTGYLANKVFFTIESLNCPLSNFSETNCPLKQSGCPENCNCSWAPYQSSLVIECTDRDLDFYPNLSFISSVSLPYRSTTLNLQFNRLTRGPSSNLLGYSNITKLYLSNNQITTIDWLPKNLEILHLDNNAISQINATTLSYLEFSSIRELTLHNNPWNCNRKLKSFVAFLHTHSNIVSISC